MRVQRTVLWEPRRSLAALAARFMRAGRVRRRRLRPQDNQVVGGVVNRRRSYASRGGDRGRLVATFCGASLACLVGAGPGPLHGPAAAQSGLSLSVRGQIGGASGAVALHGNVAWVAQGARLVGFDVTPSAPSETPVDPATLLRPVGRSPILPGVVRDVAIVDGHAFVAAGPEVGLLVLDVSKPDAVHLLAELDTPGTASGVAARGAIVVLADGVSGLLFVDVTEPATPTISATLDVGGAAADVALAKAFAVVTLGLAPWQAGWPGRAGGVAVVDIRDGAAPSLRSVLDPRGAPLAVTAAGEHAYVAVRRSADGEREADEALVVVDVDGRGDGDDEPRILGAGTMGDGLRPTDLATGLASHGRYVLAGGARMRVMDLYDPARPVLLRHLDAPASAVVVGGAGAVLSLPRGGVALYGTGRGGVLYHHATRGAPGSAVDVLPWPGDDGRTGNAQTAPVGSLATGLADAHGVWRIDVDPAAEPGDLVSTRAPYRVAAGIVRAAAVLAEPPGFVLQVDGGIAGPHVDLVDILPATSEDRAAPAAIGRGAWRAGLSPSGVAVAGRSQRLLVLDSSATTAGPGALSLHVLDATDRRRPRPITAVPDVAGTAITADDEFAYVLGNDLSIWRLDAPTDPQIPETPLHGPVHVASIAGPADTLAVAGGWAYTHDGDTVRVINVADPAAPSEAARWPLDGPPRGLYADARFVAVALGHRGVALIDPAVGPAGAARFDTPGEAQAVWVDGDTLWVADGDGGLLALNIRADSGVEPTPTAAPMPVAPDALPRDAHRVASAPRHTATRAPGDSATGRQAMPPVDSRYATVGGTDANDAASSIGASSVPVVGTSGTSGTSGGRATVRRDGLPTVRGNPDREFGGSGSDPRAGPQPDAAVNMARIAQDEAPTGRIEIDHAFGGATTAVGGDRRMLVGRGARVLALRSAGQGVAAAVQAVSAALPGVVRALADEAAGRPSERIYAAVEGFGLQTLRVDNRSNALVAVAHIPMPDAVALAVSGDLLWVATGEGRSVIGVDVSDPDAPRSVVTVPLDGAARAVVIADSTLAIALGPDGIALFDISDPLQPRPAATVALPGDSQGMYVDRESSLLLVAAGVAGVHAIRIAEPTAPTIAWTLPQPVEPPFGPVGEAVAVSRVGDVGIVAGAFDPAASGAGLRSFTWDDEGLPRVLATLNLPGEAAALGQAGSHVLAAGSGGLVWFDAGTQAQMGRLFVTHVDAPPGEGAAVAVDDTARAWLGEGGDQPGVWRATFAPAEPARMEDGATMALAATELAMTSNSGWALLEGGLLRTFYAPLDGRVGPADILPAPGAVAIAARGENAAWLASAADGALEPDLRMIGRGGVWEWAVTRRQILPGEARDVVLPAGNASQGQGEDGRAVLVAGDEAGLLAIQLAAAGRTPVIWDGALNAPAVHVAVAGATAWVDDGRGTLHRLNLDKPALPALLGGIRLPTDEPLLDLAAGERGAWFVRSDGVVGFVDASVAITETTITTRTLPAPALRIAAMPDGDQAIAAVGEAGWFGLRSPLAKPPRRVPAPIYMPWAER